MKQPFCAGFLLLTVGGDAVSIVAAQLEGGRAGCGFRTAASRLVAVVVGLGSPIKRPFRGRERGIRMAKQGGERGPRYQRLATMRLAGAQTQILQSNLNPPALERTDSGHTLVLYNQRSRPLG